MAVAGLPWNNLRPGRRLWLGGLVWLWLATVALAVDFPLRWRWSNPAPHGNNIYDMAFLPSQNLAVQVTERGQVYTSSDFRLWTVRDSGTDKALRGVAFLGSNPARIVVTGESGTVLYADAPTDFLAGTLTGGATSDWLEAVTASPNLAVAVGDNGAIYTSPDGVNWKRQSAPAPATTWLRGVAYGNNTFVAAGESGYIIRSANGTNWTKIASGSNAHLNRVSFGANRFTIVGENGSMLTSTNSGLNWSMETTGASLDLFNAANGLNVRLGVGDEELRLWENGVWTDQLSLSNGPPAWTYYANVARPNYFLVGGRTGMLTEGYQLNGNPYLWLLAESNAVRHWLFDMVYATNLYVAVGDRATVMSSGNGVDWNLELVPEAVTNAIWLGVGGTTNLLLAAGNHGSLIYSPNILTNITVPVTNEAGGIVLSNTTISSLGVLWFPVQPRPSTNDLQGICHGHGLYVVSGDNGFLMTSPDGTNWTQRMLPTASLLSGVTAWPGGFVVTGDDGAILTSVDGETWLARDSQTTDWIYKVRYLGGRLIGVGQNGAILMSTNGADWSRATSGTSAWLNDATMIEDTYFVVGTQGTVLTSSNALEWVDRGTVTKKSLYTAATDSRQLVVAGVEGAILRSPVVPDLTPIQILSYARVVNTNTPAMVNHLYLFGGKPDQQFHLDRRANLEVSPWNVGNSLELFDGSGTLFYFESIPLEKSPAEEFFRTTLESSSP